MIQIMRQFSSNDSGCVLDSTMAFAVDSSLIWRAALG